MNINENEKTRCENCLEEIIVGAQKCPHCQSPTKKKKPTKAILIGVFGYIAFFALLIGFFAVLDQFEDNSEEDALSTVKISNTSMHLMNTEMGDYVAITGQLDNKSNKTLGEIFFQVDIFDSAGNIIDCFSECAYHLKVKPNSISSFRVQDRATTDFNKYHTHKIEIRAVDKMY